MKVLVVNCGSSSIKYCLVESETEAFLAKGLIERIGEAESRYKHQAHGKTTEGVADVPDHAKALQSMTDLLMDPDHGVIASPGEIEAVGHRVVHGGESFFISAKINEAVLSEIEANASLAPLHNPPNLAGIRAAQAVFPDVAHVAVFDTAFHQSMPEHAYLYALPYEHYQEHGVRRYGFHGTSHRFVSQRAAEMLGLPRLGIRAITCHLGNGCSMSAVAGGRSVDTTMGLTPLEGLVMGTRSGDIDPAIPFFLQKRLGLGAAAVETMLNKQSGLLGISGLSNDMRTLREAAEKGNARAATARSVFAYRLRKYIGAYLAVLNGAHAIIFTGGIGENDARIRADAVDNMENLGVELDARANLAAVGCEAVVSRPRSRVKVMVVPTNEEIIIARDAARIAEEP